MFTATSCFDHGTGAYKPPSPPVSRESGQTRSYATLTGKLSGAGIVTLDGRGGVFEAIGDSAISNLEVSYESRPPRNTRIVMIGGDFAGETGLIEYPTNENGGAIRLFLGGGGKAAPFAISIVMANSEATADDIKWLDHLVNYYKGDVLLKRAEAALIEGDAAGAEGFARQAALAKADQRRCNYLLARALVKQGKDEDAKTLLTPAADEGRLDAKGYDIWLRLLDKNGKGAEGMAVLERIIKSGKLDARTEIQVRGSVYHRRLVAEGRQADARANLRKYVDLAATEEMDGDLLPLSPSDADELAARITDIIAGKPTQLLEQRFEKNLDENAGEAVGGWKLTQAKGESFYTATLTDKTPSELFPEGMLGFTKDVRMSLRVRLRSTSASVSICPQWNADGAYKLVLTSTWARLYFSTPPRQSNLEAKLLGESRFDAPVDGKWLTISITEMHGTVEVTVDGKEILEAKDTEYLKDGHPAILVGEGVVDIDDLVMTSL